MCIYLIELSVTKLVFVHSWKGGKQLQTAHEWKDKKTWKADVTKLMYVPNDNDKMATS